MGSFGRWISQVVAVTSFSVRSLPQRWGSSVAAMFGIAGVVAVFVGVLSIAAGFGAAMTNSGSDDRAISLRSGSTSELVSGLSREATRIVGETAGVLRDADGAVSSAELFLILNLPKRSTGTDANVPMRGVEEAAFRVRDDFEIVEGRSFEWSRAEVIVGRGATVEYEGLELGGTLEVAQQPWRVVGIFSVDGGIEESEIWGDARLLQSMYRRGDSFQTVLTKLESAEAFQSFQDDLSSDPRVNLSVSRQSDYYSGQSTLLTNLITGLGYLIASLMAVGAVFGALNTMYTSVSARTREIATLRALGFKSSPVIFSVLAESLLLAIVGGAIGATLAWVVFDGYRAATLNLQSFSAVAFAFDVTPALLIQGTVVATTIGLIGGLFPAIRAARTPIAIALRGL